MIRLDAFTLILTLIAAALPGAVSAQPYTVVDLGALPDQQFTGAHDINNQLQVIGTSGDQVILWDVFGMHPLGITAGEGRLHINNGGVIAGMRIVNGQQRVFVWVNGAAFEPLLPADNIQQVLELTDNGILLMQGTRSWALYGNTLYDLTTLYGTAFAVNEQAMVGGLTGFRPFLRFPDGRVTTPWNDQTPVSIIGGSGRFAGYRTSFVAQQAWYVGTPDGAARRIEPFGTGVNMSVNGVNRVGDFVGFFHLHGGRFWAFLYRNSQIIDLNTVIPPSGVCLIAAAGINDAGYIIATADTATAPNLSPTRAVVLVPTVPAAPSALTFTVVGRIVTLQWQPTIGALGYVLEAGHAPGVANLVNSAIGSQSFIATPAPAGRYYVRVRAYNAIGLSAPSNEVVIDVP